jgi:hypothetical protein
MTSRFDHLRAIFTQPVERPKSASERDRDREQLRADIAEGQRLARQQAAREPDRETDYGAWCRAQALKIANAGPLLKRLVDDEPEDADVTDGDDSPVDDKDHKKSRKRAKPAKVIGDDQSDDDAKDEGGDDYDSGDEKKLRGAANCQPGESVSAYWARVDASAAAIVRAAQRRRGEIQ